MIIGGGAIAAGLYACPSRELSDRPRWAPTVSPQVIRSAHGGRFGVVVPSSF
jgi:hypothetical protein